jgi:hypothetical protein
VDEVVVEDVVEVGDEVGGNVGVDGAQGNEESIGPFTTTMTTYMVHFKFREREREREEELYL